MTTVRLTINANTTAQNLSNFKSESQIGDTDRAWGKRSNNGEFVLYKASGPLALPAVRGLPIVRGITKRREDMAKEAVGKVLDNAERDSGAPVLVSARTALESVKALKGRSLNIIAAVADVVVEESRGPRLEQCYGLAESLSGFADRFARDSSDQAIAVELGQQIAQSFKPANDDARDDFVTSSGRILKHDLEIAFRGLLKARGQELDSDKLEALKTLLDNAYDSAASQMSPTAIKSSDQDGYPTKINVGGVTYTRDGDRAGAGAGGFGQVSRWTANGHPPLALKFATVDRIATGDDELKSHRMRQQRDHAIDAFAREIRSHKLASGHDNTVDFSGIVRTANGDVGLVMPYEGVVGKKTTVWDVTNGLVLAQDAIGPEAAKNVRLTLLKDVLLGLRHVEEQGLTHLDVKAPNCFISANGVAKIGDFGLSVDAKDYDFGTSEMPQRPDFLAPELAVNANARFATRNKHVGNETTKEIERNLILKAFKHADAGTREELMTSILANRIRKDIVSELSNVNEQENRVKAIDAWGAGQIGYNIFYNRNLQPAAGFANAKFAKLEQFAVDPKNRALSHFEVLGSFQAGSQTGTHAQWQQGFFSHETTTDNVSVLLNALMHPDPTQRMTIADALKDPLFTGPEIGSEHTRAVIVELINGDYDRSWVTPDKPVAGGKGKEKT